MRIECPHCHHGIDVVLDRLTASISCPDCGSNFSLFDPGQTTTYREKEVKRIGRFELIEHLGRGHFGDVWKARDANLNRDIALKVPRKESLTTAEKERFLREARVAASLRHPNVVPVHEVGTSDDLVFIVSDFIAGANLAEWLHDNQLEPRAAAQLCATLADALHVAHEAGIVHRDLKPANVILDSDHQPHLTDFGLAKHDGAEITMTVGGQVLGTPAYMSPEQARGDGHAADRRSDIYSLGVMLYEMLVGRRPFSGSSKLLLIHQVLYADAPPPRRTRRSIPVDLETICLKALEKNPRQRYQTAREMADDLRRFLEHKPILARRISWAERGWRWARRNPTVASLSTTVALLLVIASVLGMRSAPVDPRLKPRQVHFTTTPAGARVTFVPLDADTDEPIPELAVRPKEVTPLSVKLKPGHYLVVAIVDRHGFHEVYRTVPAPGDESGTGRYRHQSWTFNNDVIELPSIERIPTEAEATAGMVRFAGGEFDAGDDSVPGSPRFRTRIVPFWLSPTEVTVREFKESPINLSAAWTKYATLRGDSDPVTFVDYFRALEYAEHVGLRIPTQYEYEFGATSGGTKLFPWPDQNRKIETWPIGGVRTSTFDRTNTTPPVFGLYSGVVEWTDSRQDLKSAPPPVRMPPAYYDLIRHGRVIRGGPYSVAEGRPNLANAVLDVRYRAAFANEASELPGLGIRCARSGEPRFQAAPGN